MPAFLLLLIWNFIAGWMLYRREKNKKCTLFLFTCRLLQFKYCWTVLLRNDYKVCDCEVICLHHKNEMARTYIVIPFLLSFHHYTFNFLTISYKWNNLRYDFVVWNYLEFWKSASQNNKDSLVIYALTVIFTSLNFHWHILYFFI